MSAELPLAGLRFSVAGPGKVGTSLAAWSVAAGARLERSAGRGALPDLDTSGQDLLLVAVPEAQMSRAAALLAEHRQAAVVFHTAGSLGSAALAPVAARGSACGVLHPLKAFPRPLPEPTAGRGITFGWSGDPASHPLACRLVEAWGGVLVKVPDEVRTLYHLAATLAAGGVVTLLAAACELAGRLGLPSEVSAGYFNLARGSLEAAAEAEAAAPGGAAGSLTGPIARGDVGGIERSLEALSRVAPDKCALVISLAAEGASQLRRVQPNSQSRAAFDDALRSVLAEALEGVLNGLHESNQNTDSE